MKNTAKNIVRRSIALPNELVEELRTIAPPELRNNFNRLVTYILIDFTKRQKKYQFETTKEKADEGLNLLQDNGGKRTTIRNVIDNERVLEKATRDKPGVAY